MPFAVSLDRPKEPQIAVFNSNFSQHDRVAVQVENTLYRFWCRPFSTDIDVLFDTFLGLFHLPPRMLPPGAVIVDLGSNIGATLLHFGTIYPTARLIGVELDEENAKLALVNCTVLGNRVAVVNAAIWHEEGIVAYTGADAWGLKVDPSGSKQARSITMRKLVSIFQLKSIDFLKVDIEGAERELFSGELEWLSLVGALHIEVHHGQPLVDSLLALLDKNGFRAWKDPRHPWGVAAVRGR